MSLLSALGLRLFRLCCCGRQSSWGDMALLLPWCAFVQCCLFGFSCDILYGGSRRRAGGPSAAFCAPKLYSSFMVAGTQPVVVGPPPRVWFFGPPTTRVVWGSPHNKLFYEGGRRPSIIISLSEGESARPNCRLRLFC